MFNLYRIWFLLKQSANDSSSSFNWSRDSIYIAVALLGIGGSTLMVISLSMISLLVGEFSVSHTQVHTCMHVPGFYVLNLGEKLLGGRGRRVNLCEQPYTGLEWVQEGDMLPPMHISLPVQRVNFKAEGFFEMKQLY